MLRLIPFYSLARVREGPSNVRVFGTGAVVRDTSVIGIAAWDAVEDAHRSDAPAVGSRVNNDGLRLPPRCVQDTAPEREASDDCRSKNKDDSAFHALAIIAPRGKQ